MDGFSFPRSYTIPLLDEIVAPDTHLTDCGPYNRSLFVQFLSTSHCMENLEFVVELDRFLVASTQLDHLDMSDSQMKITDQLMHLWRVIYRVFLAHNAIKEINIPCLLLTPLAESELPRRGSLLAIRAVIYELLTDSYNEFISHTRHTHNDVTARRRPLELVPPERHTLPIESYAPRSVAFGRSDRTVADHNELREQWERAHLTLGKLDAASELELPRSRTGSSGTLSSARTSSRGLSIGLIVENIKDYSGWRKTVKKFKSRRSLDEVVE